jgi:hypothetical protein
MPSIDVGTMQWGIFEERIVGHLIRIETAPVDDSGRTAHIIGDGWCWCGAAPEMISGKPLVAHQSLALPSREDA